MNERLVHTVFAPQDSEGPWNLYQVSLRSLSSNQGTHKSQPDHVRVVVPPRLEYLLRVYRIPSSLLSLTQHARAPQSVTRESDHELFTLPRSDGERALLGFRRNNWAYVGQWPSVYELRERP
ncbi:MAG: hypothetical protein Nkreftii_000504 [Candidatus Nitrospira kreftii]|uniref:Uncharacterized protein n=1 Tax=Candidatus Nitrospira kreftii TaxID=2652173 RepID=A0A7S8IYA4_9BACT|nr:MAG: hypothetical protein Nkreftii_000504 [Candidatus Nitrospira kreftii]